MQVSNGMIWRLRLKIRQTNMVSRGNVRGNGVPKYQSFARERERERKLECHGMPYDQCTEALKNPSLGMQGPCLRLLRRLVDKM